MTTEPSHCRLRGVAWVLLATAAVACGVPRLPSLPPPGPEALPAPPEFRDQADALDPAGIAPDCFQRHLREAISLNERRMGIYSAWTAGESESISRRLIAAERGGLLAAWWVDRSARRYHAAGIPIVCAEFVSMAMTPLLEDEPGPPPPYGPPSAPDARALEATLAGAYETGGFIGLAAAAAAELVPLSAAPEFACMTRHLLESIARTAGLAPRHEEKARTLHLPSPRGLSELMIRLHMAVLADAIDLDAAAAPLQALGVPIICRDVPPIPYPTQAGEA